MARHRRSLLVFLSFAAALSGGYGSALLGVCGPFADVAADAFCPFVLEIFTLGITTGTSPTTYDPASAVSRLQMAAFLSRTVDGVLERGKRRAALDQFWTTQNSTVLGVTTLASSPALICSDGADLWIPSANGGTIIRVRASDGRVLETWTGATAAFTPLVAMGRVFATGLSPGRVYQLDPSQPAGAVTLVASGIPSGPVGIAFDGARIWTANLGPPASVSIVTPGASIPWTVTTVTTGFSAPVGPVYDGTNIWVTDANRLQKLDADGAILQTVTVGAGASHPVFDGSNIWVPSFNGNSVSVVRASSGAILTALTGNGLDGPEVAAFDGQRVLVTSQFSEVVSLWKGADLTPIGFVSTGNGTHPFGVASDGINFWVTLYSANKLARF